MKFIKSIFKILAITVFWLLVAVGLILGGTALKQSNPELGSALINFGILKIMVITLIWIFKGIIFVSRHLIFGVNKTLIPKGYQWKIVSNTSVILLILGIIAFVGGMLIKGSVSPDVNQNESLSLYEILFSGDVKIKGIDSPNLFTIIKDIKSLDNFNSKDPFFQQIISQATISIVGTLSLICATPFLLYAFLLKWGHIKKLARIGAKTLEMELK